MLFAVFEVEPCLSGKGLALVVKIIAHVKFFNIVASRSDLTFYSKIPFEPGFVLSWWFCMMSDVHTTMNFFLLFPFRIKLIWARTNFVFTTFSSKPWNFWSKNSRIQFVFLFQVLKFFLLLLNCADFYWV